MLCISANLKNIISVTEINVAITVPTPVLIPIRLRTNKNTSSVVDGIENSDTENLIGSANFSTPSIALMEKVLVMRTKQFVHAFLGLESDYEYLYPLLRPAVSQFPKLQQM